MKKRVILSGAVLAMVGALAGCSDSSPATSTDAGTGSDTGATTDAGTSADRPASTGDGSVVPAVTAGEAMPVLTQYRGLVHGSYAQSVIDATTMQTAITAFLAAPTEPTLAAARTAWINARVIYGQTEAYRFYGGPIDDETNGVEGQLNAWPMDENYVDYVVGMPTSGIINNTAMFPTLTRESLVMANERGGEANVATGWHAIEFLLWGQDLSVTGPGARPATDYLTVGGTASNQMRRGQYLRLVTEQLVADLTTVRDAWTFSSSTNYGASFGNNPTEAIRRMFTGMGALSGAELAGERMSVAYNTREQENEHSCFSDNTKADLLNNAIGIQNVYLGRLGTQDGPGLNDLVRTRNAALNTRLEMQLQASVDAIQAIQAPFDAAIQGADGSPQRQAIATAIAALRAQRNTIVEAAAALGVSLTLEE